MAKRTRIEERLAALEAWKDDASKDAEIKRLRAEIDRLSAELMHEQKRRINAELAR